ncbi:hypothetical protein [Nocardia sp. NPDC004260]
MKYFDNKLREFLQHIKSGLDDSIYYVARIKERPLRESTTVLKGGVERQVDIDHDAGSSFPGAGEPFVVDNAAQSPWQQVRAMHLTVDDELTKTLGRGVNRTFVVRDTGNNGLYIYKPASGENFDGVDWIPPIPGELAKREVAAFRIDQLYGFGRVPPTIIANGPHGPGSLQSYIQLGKAKKWNQYDTVQRQQAAILHHTIGHIDGGPENYGPDLDGNLISYDHGLAFPEAPHPPAHHFDSDFIITHRGEQIDETVMRAVDAVEPDRIHAALNGLVSESAIEGAVIRHETVRSAGMIPRA